ncbi:MAG: methyltransferase domain-containing protein [Bdellovibrionales bacterium]|nr:methyltransferase domain-containing protein [Bdellovibrionales bacterium]
MHRWSLTAEGEKKFNFGHPWIFAGDINSSIKSSVAGQLVQLTGPRGNLLGMAYVNPNSLITLRRLSTDPQAQINSEWVSDQLLRAAQYRHQLDLAQFSHRLIFSEADSLPGLIIDCFFTEDDRQIFTCEVLTAGAEMLFKESESIFKSFLKKAHDSDLPYRSWENTTLLIKRDNSFRRMEKIEIAPLQALGQLEIESLKKAKIRIQSAFDGKQFLLFECDLIEGQKTGFFLDQRNNIELFIRLLRAQKPQRVRVLDLFCYVGQWSAQIANACRQLGIECEVTPVDASQKALEFARENISPYTSKINPLKMDIVEKCNELPQGEFDIVICDPPALIKSKKDVHAGTAAYTKVNTASLKSLKPGGLFVSCSCSQHLGDKDLVEVLATALRKSHKKMHWLARGQQGYDHPSLIEFPQGTYLNSWQGISPCQESNS